MKTDSHGYSAGQRLTLYAGDSVEDSAMIFSTKEAAKMKLEVARRKSLKSDRVLYMVHEVVYKNTDIPRNGVAEFRNARTEGLAPVSFKKQGEMSRSEMEQQIFETSGQAQ